MTKQELEEKINQAEMLLNELKSELEKQKDEPEFSRVPYGKSYFLICSYFGEFSAYTQCEAGRQVDEKIFNSNNYFYTKERAQEVVDKINFLLKTERLHDIFCPGYVPDWKDGEDKYCAYRDGFINEFVPTRSSRYEDISKTYFPDLETAQKVCDILNEELKNKSES